RGRAPRHRPRRCGPDAGLPLRGQVHDGAGAVRRRPAGRRPWPPALRGAAERPDRLPLRSAGLAVRPRPRLLLRRLPARLAGRGRDRGLAARPLRRSLVGEPGGRPLAARAVAPGQPARGGGPGGRGGGLALVGRRPARAARPPAPGGRAAAVSLFERIERDLVTARKERDETRLATLGLLKS